MSEYDKKIEEIKELCKWFNEHQDEVAMHEDDGIILAAVHESKVTNIAIGDGVLVASMLGHLIEGCHQRWQEEIEQ